MSTASSKKARNLLEEVGVNVMLKTEALEVKKCSVVIDHGEVKSELIIFAGGLKGSEVIDELGYTNRNHRIVVDEQLRSIDVFGVGDCATFQNYEIPMSADIAINMVRVTMLNALGATTVFKPRRLTTVFRIGNEYFGDLEGSYVEGYLAKIIKGFTYVHNRSLIKYPLS